MKVRGQQAGTRRLRAVARGVVIVETASHEAPQQPARFARAAASALHGTNRTVDRETVEDVDGRAGPVPRFSSGPFDPCNRRRRLHEELVQAFDDAWANRACRVLFLLEEPAWHHDIRIDRPERYPYVL